jgi:hypothetical protein
MVQTAKITKMFMHAYWKILFEQDFDNKNLIFYRKVAMLIIDYTFTRFPSGPNMYEA